MRNAVAVFKFLTQGGRFTTAPFIPERVGKGAPYFPFVGLILGLTLALLNRVLEPYLESEVLAVLLVTILIVLTRASHLDGTRKVFDGWSVRKNRASEQGASGGTYGFLAVILLLLFKIRSVEVIGELRNVTLLLTPALARWTVVIFLYSSTSMTDDLARRIAENVRAWHLLITTVVTLGVTVFLVGVTGLWIGLCLSLFALLFRSSLHQFGSDLTRDHIGALIEASEAVTFVLFASL
jgi:cobalamin synthase